MGRTLHSAVALRAKGGEETPSSIVAAQENIFRRSREEEPFSDTLAKAKRSLVGENTASDERKLRATIESILRDKEELRASTSMGGGAMFTKASSTFGLATLASLTVGLTQPWCAALLPTLTGLMFVFATSAESSGLRYKGAARLHAANAELLSSQQEAILAEAEIRKAELPFWVGATAIISASCVSLRLFNERVAENTAEGDSNPLFGYNVLLLTCVVASVLGAMFTSDQYLRMRTTLTLQPEQITDNETEWEQRRLPSVTTEPSSWDRFITAGSALTIALSPLAIVAGILGFNASGMDPGAQFSLKLQETADEAAVVISAISGTLAALVYLLAEKDFADAEQRIAIQAKQAALSELFFAQALAEAAGLAVRSAVVGFALGAGELLVEGVGLVMTAAAAAPWPGLLSTIGSTMRSKLVRYEADAAYLECQRAEKGDPTLVQAENSALASTVNELQRIRTDVLRVDSFTDKTRAQMRQIPLGGMTTFPKLRREDRRKVHSIAAELGFTSQSVSEGGQRVVMVANERGVFEKEKDAVDMQGVVGQLVQDSQVQVGALFRNGIPPDARSTFNTAAVIAALTVASPALTTELEVELVSPFGAGALALQTVLQERNSKTVVGQAKREHAKVSEKLAAASGRLGLATVAQAALPTCISAGTTAAIASCICFVCSETLIVKMFSLAMLAISAAAHAAAVQRQRRVRKFVTAALEQVDGPRLPHDILWSRGNWPAICSGLLLLAPGSMLQRLTLANATLTIGTVLIMSSACCDLSAGEYYVARSERVLARIDAWSQEASCASRALPFGSAAAIVNTLLATALVSSVGPFSVLFSVVGLGVSARALQFNDESQRYARLAEKERQDLQALDTGLPSPWECKSAKYAAAVSRAGRGEWAGGAQDNTRSSVLRMEQQRRRRRLWMRLLEGTGRGAWSLALRRTVVSFLKVWQEAPPDTRYTPTPAQRAVESVRDDMQEVSVSVRSSEKNWQRTGSAVVLSTVAALLSPVVLSNYFVGLILPVVGAGLTLFAVASESNSRRSVAASKVWSAQLAEVTNFLEEMTSSSAIYRHRLVALTGVTACLAVAGLGVEHHWHVPAALQPVAAIVQPCVQLGLVGLSSFLAARCTDQAMLVRHWSRQVQRWTAAPIDEASLSQLRVDPPEQVFRQNWLWNRRCPPLALLAAAFPWVLAFWPLARPLGQRVVAATAAGAFVVCTSLLIAERSATQAELLQAQRAQTYALADAFSNEAEQQAALLPLASAATIAISAFIAFGTEVNPVGASALTILQGVAWIVASRKGLAAKFESTACLQVEQVAESSAPSWRSGQGDDLRRRIRRMLLRWI